MNVFDLNKKYPEYKKGNLQKNLIEFEKKFGKKFKIKYNNITIEATLAILKLKTGKDFYSIFYDPVKKTTELYPFKIDFISPIDQLTRNETYISNIQKTDKLSGSDLVKICLAINRILGAEKTTLGDGAEIICEKTGDKMDLSYLKLIENKMTFYMKHGFNFDIRGNLYFPFKFSNIKELREEINRLINNIRRIKTKDIISYYENVISLLQTIMKNNDEKEFEAVFNNGDLTNPDSVRYEKPKIKELFNEAIDVLLILYKYAKKYDLLYKILVKLFKDSCDEYIILHKYICKQSRVKIIYKNKIIKSDYVMNFKYLEGYRSVYLFTYEF